MTEAILTDAILRDALQILRLSAGDQARVTQVLDELERELKALLSTADLGDATRRDIEALAKQAGEAIEASYRQAGATVDTVTLARHVAEKTQEIIEEIIPLPVKLPTEAMLMQLGKDVLIDGAPSSAWWAKQADDLAFRFAAQVRQGVVNSETQEQIVARITGKRGEPGIMETSRRNARALVHSSVMTAANQARLETFRRNGRFIKGVRWLATLDGHVCFTGETLVLMADGSQRPISEIRENDMVIGGISGLPCRVDYADKRLAPSTVAIHKDGHVIGRATSDHPILTPTGWREIGSVALSADFSEREVLCRDFQAPECATERASQASGERGDTRHLSGVAQTWRADHADHRQGDELRDGLCNGGCPDRSPEYEGPEWLQYDGWWGRADRSDPGRELVGQDNGEQSAQGGGPYRAGNAPSRDSAVLERSGIQGKGQCCEGSQAGGTAERPRLEGSQSGEGCGDHAQEMARPRISGEDGSSAATCSHARSQSAGSLIPFGEHDCGATCGSSQEVLGNPQSTYVGTIGGELINEPVEVHTLTIEGDPTFVAGGMIVHNCVRCAALDGQAWNLDGEKLPGTKVTFLAPPIHFGDRCVLSPIPKTFRDIGLDIPEPEDAGQRASSLGPVHGKTTFDDFLKRQSPEFVARTLGKKRAELFAAGKLTVRDLVSGTGRELTLDELRKH